MQPFYIILSTLVLSLSQLFGQDFMPLVSSEYYLHLKANEINPFATNNGKSILLLDNPDTYVGQLVLDRIDVQNDFSRKPSSLRPSTWGALIGGIAGLIVGISLSRDTYLIPRSIPIAISGVVGTGIGYLAGRGTENKRINEYFEETRKKSTESQ